VLRDKKTKELMGACICYDYYDCPNVNNVGAGFNYDGFAALN